MRCPIGRGLAICVITLATAIPSAPAAAQSATVKVAFWNVRSGKGAAALPGHPTPFVDSTNCTDLTQPLNAWGAGAVQAELAKLNADPSVVALGIAESWYNVCGSPANIRAALGWNAMTNEQNGVSLIARYGLAGAAQWQQLDTSLNTMPTDTMWVLRVPVCINTACTDSMPVYVAHWYGMGTNEATEYARQAQQTAAFLTATASGPHVLVGDLNVWEGTTTVCSQAPINGALGYLRSAGYFDAWLTINGGAEGYTGMINRAGCGSPVGYAWKRIDYAWTPASFQPLDIRRFGIVPAGDAAPSDHYGIVVTLPYPGTSPTPPPPPGPAPAPAPAPGDIVLYAKNATVVQGAWSLVTDTTAAGGARMANPDAGAAKLTSATAAPASYFELPFTAQTGVAYRLWIRGKAQNDSWQNDSTFVQFSGSLDANGAPTFRIGTTAATVISVEEASGAGLSGWGWQDNGYGYGVYGPLVSFAQAQQTLRIQVREDGLSIDQIVLSPAQYLTAAPGLAKNDSTILPASTSSPAPPAPAPTAIAWTNIVKASATGAQLTKTSGCNTCSDAGGVTQQAVGTDGSMSFSVNAGKRLVVGLGRDTSPNTGYAIDYAFSFSDTGVFEVREAGVYRCEGTFSGSDVFRITVTAGVVKYYRNEVLMYTSRTVATGPLVGDTSLQTLGATVTVLTLQ